MDRLLKAILDYAQTNQTDYAILLTGKWGSGKTFYWKNILSPAISNAHITVLYRSMNHMSYV